MEGMKHLNNNFTFSQGLRASLKKQLKLITFNKAQDIKIYKPDADEAKGGIYEFNDTSKYYIRPHFDIDLSQEEGYRPSGDVKHDVSEYLSKSNIIEFIIKEFNCRKQDCVICYTERLKHQKPKLSLHINLKNTYTTMRELINWLNPQRQYLKEKYYIDFDNYNVGENKFRCIGGCKWDKNETYRVSAPKTLYTKHKDIDTLIYYSKSRMQKWSPPKQEAKKIVNSFSESKESEEVEEEHTEPMETGVSEELDYLLVNINKSRYVNYQEWWLIGAIIYNEGGELDDYCEYSKLAPRNYPDQEEACRNNWEGYSGYNGKKVRIGTLRYWLKQDNKEKYIEYEKKFGRDAVNMFLNDDELNDRFFAETYYNLNMDKYAYSEISGWYSFDKYNKYINHDKLPMGINNDVDKCVGDYLKTKMNEICVENENFGKCLKTYKILRSYLRSGSKIRCMINTFLFELYYVKDLDKKLDDNFNLVACENMVFDKTIKKWRDIKREDYISRNTGIVMNLGEDVEGKELILKFMNSIMPNAEMVEYVRGVLANAFFGNIYEKLYTFIGKGGNGKGVLMGLVEKVFGDYYKTTSPSFLTSKCVGKDRPDADLYGCYKKRLICVSEPDNEDGDLKYNLNFVKSITGRDTMSVRAVYGKTRIEFPADFTTILQCNEMPKLTEVDDAVKRRMNQTKFPYSFKTKPNPKLSWEKQRDVTLKDKLGRPEVHCEFLKWLLSSDRIGTRDLIIPPEVSKNTEEYINKNNFAYNFINDGVIFDRIETKMRRYWAIDQKAKKKDWVKWGYLYAQFCKSKPEFVPRKSEFKKNLEDNNYIIDKRDRVIYLIEKEEEYNEEED